MFREKVVAMAVQRRQGLVVVVVVVVVVAEVRLRMTTSLLMCVRSAWTTRMMRLWAEIGVGSVLPAGRVTAVVTTQLKEWFRSATAQTAAHHSVSR